MAGEASYGAFASGSVPSSSSAMSAAAPAQPAAAAADTAAPAAAPAPTDADADADADAAAEATEAPGYLASRLDTVFANALAHTLRACSWANFAACFPTPAARRPDVLQNVWQQVVGKIEAKARREYASIMAERDVVRGLNELEALVGEARARRDRWKAERERAEEAGGGEVAELPVPLHTLPPEALYSANLAPQLEVVAKELQAKTVNLSTENERLFAGIAQQTKEVEDMIRQLESVVKDLEAANETLDDAVEEHGLRQEIMDIQKDLDEVDSKL